MENNKPTLWRIFQTDYLTAVSGTFILVMWGFYLFFNFVQPGGLAAPLFYASIVVTVVGAIIVTWRIRLIRSTFEDGVEVEGAVVSVGFYRDRGHVAYAYEVNGERCQSSNAIMKERFTSQLKPGQKVTLIVSRDNPRNAFIKTMYL
ncbi:MAG: hypothetical protein HY869_02580 [Chloroflexi bacterium]|nr:hypothetical protein [Chloroflexota bacterium]